jgi:hypothetical protein
VNRALFAKCLLACLASWSVGATPLAAQVSETGSPLLSVGLLHTSPDSATVQNAAAPSNEQPTEDEQKESNAAAVRFTLGYTIVRYKPSDTIAVGWSVSVSAAISRYFELASEVSGAYASRGNTGTDSGIFFVNGPRFTFPTKTVTIFGDLLVGIAHDGALREVLTSDNRMIARGGGGLDVWLSDSVAARFQAGRVFYFPSSDRDPTVSQFTTALVFGRRK